MRRSLNPDRDYKTPVKCYEQAPVRRLTVAETHQQQWLAIRDDVVYIDANLKPTRRSAWINAAPVA